MNSWSNPKYEQAPSFFDIITFQEEVRNCTDDSKLYGLYDRACKLYSEKKISEILWEEATFVVQNQFKAIKQVREVCT